ncbi:unnamed protein product [Eretmochelys imbricata]
MATGRRAQLAGAGARSLEQQEGEGSAGYCPPNESCRQLTSPLPTSPEVAGSSQLMLQPAPWPCPWCPARAAGRGAAGDEAGLLGGRSSAAGMLRDPRLHRIHSRAQNLFAKTYSEICKEARSDFAQAAAESRRPGAGAAEGRAAAPGHQGQTPHRQVQDSGPGSSPVRIALCLPTTGLPLLHGGQQPPQVLHLGVLQGPTILPAKDLPLRRQSHPGFTGFVPRARFLIGAGYPLTTHRALVEFGQNRGSRPEAGKGSTVLPPLLKSYPTDMGLLPHYAGYVPGYKFQFGHNLRQLTHNALGLSTLEKQMAD